MVSSSPICRPKGGASAISTMGSAARARLMHSRLAPAASITCGEGAAWRRLMSRAKPIRSRQTALSGEVSKVRVEAGVCGAERM